jgi:hypothetical protein
MPQYYFSFTINSKLNWIELKPGLCGKKSKPAPDNDYNDIWPWNVCKIIFVGNVQSSWGKICPSTICFTINSKQTALELKSFLCDEKQTTSCLSTIGHCARCPGADWVLWFTYLTHDTCMRRDLGSSRCFDSVVCTVTEMYRYPFTLHLNDAHLSYCDSPAPITTETSHQLSSNYYKFN